MESLRQHTAMGQVQYGNRHNMRRFVGGARRSDRKPRFDLIPFEFLESVANASEEHATEQK